MRRAGALVVGAAVIVLAGAPASADTGVSVGPARQLVEPGQTRATIQVSNPTDRTMRVTTAEFIYVGGEWVEGKAGLAFGPSRFELAPHTQQSVIVALPRTTEVPCRLVGAGFGVQAEQAGTGVIVQGMGLAQLAIQGRGGTEADCAALLPQPPPKPSPGFRVPWGLVGMIAGAIALLLAGRLTKRRPKNKAYGFGG